MRRGMLLAMLLIVCVLVGIRGGVEVEDQAFVITMGLDLTPEGLLSVCLQMPSAQTDGGGSGGGTTSSRSGGYQIVEAKAANFIDAQEILRATIPRRVSFVQLLQVVISEALARSDDFLPTLESLLSTPHIRQSASLVVCGGEAKAFVEAQKPFLGVRLSTSIKTGLEVFETLGNIPYAQLGETLRNIGAAWRDVVLPYATVNQGGGGGDVLGGRALDTEAGGLQYEGENKTEYLGAAVFGERRMVGTLTGLETQFLAFLQGDMMNFTLCVDDAYYRFEQRRRTQLFAEEENGMWRIAADGLVAAYPRGRAQADAGAVEAAFRSGAERLLHKLQALGVDPVGFQGQAVRTAWTLEEWDRTDWRAAYRSAQVEVSVRVILSEES